MAANLDFALVAWRTIGDTTSGSTELIIEPVTKLSSWPNSIQLIALTRR